MQAEYAHFVDHLIDAWNSHDPAQVATYYAPHYQGVDIGQNAPFQGPADVQEYFARFYQAFPDSHIRVDSVVAEPDRYAVAWTMYGTHQGKLNNIPPSGKSIKVRGVSLLTIDAGKVVQTLTIWDMAGLLRAIGLLPKLSR